MFKIRTVIPRLSNRIRNIRYAASGAGFINRVLEAKGCVPISEVRYHEIFDEVVSDELLALAFERWLPTRNQAFPQKRVADWRERIARWPNSVDIFYVLMRVCEPDFVVETGVAAGMTTSFILAALHKNNRGRLLSFDLPPKTAAPEMGLDIDEDDIGLLVPEVYRNRWELTVGDATYELPAKIRSRTIDAFLHDSLHTYDHMMYEYAFAAKHVRLGGLLISDDVTLNQSFFRFWEDRGSAIILHRGNPNIGIAVV